METNFLLKNVNIVDVENGVLPPAKHVTIQGEKIIAIYGEGDMFPTDSVRIIDGKGKYLIPGLWDMHTHFNWSYEFASPDVSSQWGDRSYGPY